MTKADLVEKLVDRGMSRSTAMEAVDGVVETMAETLSSGESITLRGLGTFKVRMSKAKTARNIAAGTSLTVPSHKSVKLILSKKIKDALK